VSLIVVTSFIGLLGIVFLPREAQRLAKPQYVSVTHSLVSGAGRPAISLFWSIGTTGSPGWRHHLAIHPLNASRPDLVFPCPLFNPLALAAGPDADHALVGNWDGTIYSLDLRRPNVEPTPIGRQSDGGVIALACSAAGRCVVSQSAFQLYAWDLSSHSQRWRRDDVAAYCFVLRPDSAFAFVSTLRGELIEIDLRDGRTVRTLARYERPALAAALNADGSQLAILRADGSLLLLDSRTAAVRWDEKAPHHCQTAAGRFAVFSPCGKLLVTAGQDSGSALTIWSVATGRRLMELRGHQKVVLGAAFAANGTLRSWGADGTIRAWDLGTGAATQVALLAPPSPAS
jgi:WD40 repeat protein